MILPKETSLFVSDIKRLDFQAILNDGHSNPPMPRTVFQVIQEEPHRFNTPLPATELDALLSQLKLSPSESLVKLWKLIGPGTFLLGWDLYIASPGQSVIFTSDEIYGEYKAITN
jgi:hypothetical protein